MRSHRPYGVVVSFRVSENRQKTKEERVPCCGICLCGKKVKSKDSRCRLSFLFCSSCEIKAQSFTLHSDMGVIRTVMFLGGSSVSLVESSAAEMLFECCHCC